MASSTSFLPSTDAGLLAWSLNFNTLIQTGAVSYGLTVPLATAYGVLHDAYAAALAAADPAIRTRGSVAAKNTARANLKANARLLDRLVQGTGTVTDQQKRDLGLNVRSAPSPIPPPADAPGLDILSVSAWTVKIKLHDTASSAKRGKPPGVTGASIFSFVGAEAPADIGSWQFEGNTGKTKGTVTFPNTLAAGAQVWITAFWFNGRKQSGPACAPVPTNLQGGGVSLAA
jgi:hypothetical protein